MTVTSLRLSMLAVGLAGGVVLVAGGRSPVAGVSTDGGHTAEPAALVATWVEEIAAALRLWPTTAADESPATVSRSTVPRLPDCRYRDQRTRYDRVRDWRITLLDTNLRLPRDYEPWDLVPVSRAGIAGSGRVRRLVIEDLRALADAARAAGKPLAVRSAHRTHAVQAATFESWVRRAGYDQALLFSARPGHSEHQLGTAIDFATAPGVPLSTSFGRSPAGKWLRRNGWKHGFVLSYPEGKRRQSCYGYEPWHWRYVGRELAAAIQASGTVPRRYLWESFETAP